ncbi:hypothetical protein [Beggiatoa leptomitoformis]|uniref:J domain-containing protein n=1 Tax=Beggiatoa leptomitoformis TaxID=288004 RepID=A0A2N9YIH2_9GAMM|nr:hypothetical protein [Beggiatoa leptomitoformis]ALG67571.1 hypothetical protein AL038_07485 [Beggiatoa leptomitoformis]AUI70199.1 hypothetical protein BLE401_16830 [Beggiatoa leptomitoformis]
MKSYYDIIGVTPEATEEDIKKAMGFALQKASNDRQKMAIKRIYQVLAADGSRKNYDKALRYYNILGLDLPVEEKQLQQAANKKLQATKEGSKQLLINRALEELSKNYGAYSDVLLTSEQFTAVSKLSGIKKAVVEGEAGNNKTLFILIAAVMIAGGAAAYFFLR